jgi:hypothetical protein
MECGGLFTLLAPIFEGSFEGPPLLLLQPSRKTKISPRPKSSQNLRLSALSFSFLLILTSVPSVFFLL